MIRVGPAGWSYADWEGTVYPRPKPRDFHALPYLARTFDLFELNSSFYGIPPSRNAESWVRRLEDHPGVRFTAKLYGGFTHRGSGVPQRAQGEGGEGAKGAKGAKGARRARGARGGDRGRRGEPSPDAHDDPDTWARDFAAGLAPLRAAGKLDALLAQFPVSFRRGSATLGVLERIAGLFPDWPRVAELRHRSWFGPEGLAELRALGYSTAWLDLPTSADHLPDRFEPTGPLGYLRLHGRNAKHWFDPRAGRDQRYDYLYGREELQDIVARVRSLAGGTDATYVVTNNHFQGQAVANGIELLSELRTPGEPIEAPEPVLRRFPHLAKLNGVRAAPTQPNRGSPPDGQLELF